MERFGTIAEFVANPEFAKRHTAFEVGSGHSYSILWPLETTGIFTVGFFQADIVEGREPIVEFHERLDITTTDVLSREATTQELVVFAGVAQKDLEGGNLRVGSLLEYARRRFDEDNAA